MIIALLEYLLGKPLPRAKPKPARNRKRRWIFSMKSALVAKSDATSVSRNGKTCGKAGAYSFLFLKLI